MKNLIICEKPNVAKNVCDALKKRERFTTKDGYYESNKFIVSWCFGHLLTLKDVSDYEGEKVKWSQIELPYIPKPFQYKLKSDSGAKKQFNLLKKLINDENVTAIYNCGDNDSEGQILVDEVLMACRNKKTVYRMILPDQTEKTILKEIDRKALNSEYKNFAAEGFARQRMDWLYGINTTVLLTTKSGCKEKLNCGRLIAPIVKKIYDVDMSIKNFVPTKFYQCESNVDGIKLIVSIKFDEANKANVLAERLNDEKALVKDITSKNIKKIPSKLFSLTSLQEFLNKNYKMKADEVLSICQSLYEKKVQTYPRTDSEYMSEEEKQKAKEIIQALNDSNLVFQDKKTIFDSRKVEAHSAITPTTVIPTELNEKEQLVYNTVCNRFKSNFCKEECIISSSEMIIECGNEVFKFQGEIILNEGFLKYEPISKLKTLPKLKIGQELKHEFKAIQKQTEPPKKMTNGTLLSYLKNPFREQNEEIKDSSGKKLGLGTPATRAGIIKKCCQNYIQDKNNILSITPLGISFIQAIDKLGIDLYECKTIYLSKLLKDVRNGNLSLKECLDRAEEELKTICDNSKNIELEPINLKEEKEIIGKCPYCGRNIYESSKNFYCEGFKEEPKCTFSLWKNDKFFADKGKKITKTMAKAFLKESKAKVKGLTKKNGNGKYDAYVEMIEKEINGKKYINFNMSFK